MRSMQEPPARQRCHLCMGMRLFRLLKRIVLGKKYTWGTFIEMGEPTGPGEYSGVHEEVEDERPLLSTLPELPNIRPPKRYRTREDSRGSL